MNNSKLAYQANCWGPLGGNAVGVTSITELTYQTFADMAGAFNDCFNPTDLMHSSSIQNFALTLPVDEI